jgi:hypothetical protein
MQVNIPLALKLACGSAGDKIAWQMFDGSQNGSPPGINFQGQKAYCKTWQSLNHQSINQAVVAIPYTSKLLQQQ